MSSRFVSRSPGSLREAQFVCPTHQVALERSANKVLITLQEPKAVMDRDFVMTVKAPQSAHTFALSGRDGDGLAAMASFQPFFPGLRKPRALNLAIVIDCSGSMAGDSINQAKQALDGILDGLQPHDHLTIIAFGNATNALSARLLVADKKNLKKSREFARGLEADMGGTEIGSALEVAYAAFGRSEPGDVFLVTDGEVSSWDSVVNDAKVSGHRVFTVGVGSAVSEAFVRELAEGTGGQCELVSPSENMADRIVRHFERVRAARATRVAVHWPEGARDVAPSPLRSVFEGDTVVTCARFDDPATHGAVVLEIETEEGKVGRQELQLVMAPSVESTDGLSTVARLAASIRLKGLDDAAGLETALRYRLVSPWTHWLVVAARPESERAQDAPALRKVPQSLAAGWGGTGRVAPSITQACIDRPLPPLTGSPSFSRRKATASRRAPRILKQIPFDRGEFVRSLPEATPTRVQPSAPPGFPRLLELIEVSPSRLDPRRAIELLREAGLSHELEEIFERARQSGINVEAIAALALSDLLSGVLAEELSPEALSALKHLKRWAHDMSDVMGKLARHSHDLLRLTALRGDPAGLFEPRRRHDLEAALEQVTSLADLRTAVQVFAETSNLRVLSDRATQPGRRRS
jgi:uncharacterized protein YegL